MWEEKQGDRSCHQGLEPRLQSLYVFGRIANVTPRVFPRMSPHNLEVLVLFLLLRNALGLLSKSDHLGAPLGLLGARIHPSRGRIGVAAEERGTRSAKKKKPKRKKMEEVLLNVVGKSLSG